jgi:hypothetical protein
MQRLIKQELLDIAMQKTLLLELDAIMSFIQSSFGQHVGMSSGCSCHNTGHALGVEGQKVEDGAIECEQCQSIFRWFEKLSLVVPAEHRRLVHDAEHKATLAMAHIIRTVVQQQQIKKLEVELRSNPTLCKIIVDFKMKLQVVHGAWHHVTVTLILPVGIV